MIIKNRILPINIRKLQALERRLASSHPRKEEVVIELSRRMAGYRGEKSLDYHLATLPEKEFYIFHDLRLPFQHYHFQMDTLLVTSSFILIIETKNYAGSLFFEPKFHQLVRTIDGKKETFPDPISQAERQQLHFTFWLQAHKFPPIAVEHLILISNAYTFIETDPGNHQILQKVIHSIKLPATITKLQAQYPENKYTSKDIRKLSNLLLKQHTPYNRNILQQFDIPSIDLLKGVYCPNCSYLPMKKVWGKWHCPACFETSQSAYLESLQDYALLINKTITNQELRDFLQIPSISVASKLLAAADYPYVGSTRGRIYLLSVD